MRDRSLGGDHILSKFECSRPSVYGTAGTELNRPLPVGKTPSPFSLMASASSLGYEALSESEGICGAPQCRVFGKHDVAAVLADLTAIL